ncbi:YadA-like family protein [Providencia rettgeri]|uniref:YadA-like family protein n=1 Tax=Providencia rettgeri TaxID=587 RepID=UPI001E3F0BF7|nr:YadA C-terminal domain-containing protein [Providencia rettgeri]
MKNKLLLSTLSMVILTSLSSQSLALTGYQDAINAPYDYPEHRHEDNRNIIDIQKAKIKKYANIVEEMAPIIDISTFAAESLSPMMQQSAPQTPSRSPTSTLPGSTPPSPPYSHAGSPIGQLYYPPISPDNNPPIFLQSNSNSLDERVRNNTDDINMLNISISDLNNTSSINEKINFENQMKTLDSIKELENSVSVLEGNIKNNEIKIKKYTDKELFNSEVVINSLINDVSEKNLEETKRLNAEIKKLDKQDKLHTQHFKQIDSRFERMESKINQTARDANAGIASVAAMSNIPYITGNRFSMGLGAGNFKNGKAVAAGAQYQIKQNLNVRSSISWNNSDSAVIGAGIAYGW